MEYMALATGIRVVLLPGMTGSAIMEYSYSKHENYKDSTSKSKEIHCIAYLKKSHLMSRSI